MSEDVLKEKTSVEWTSKIPLCDDSHAMNT